ncbi:hypothetical protein [Deinococcus aerophilus]|uniref:Uncharacterized protein n=1 Tax=Deinococcus aerophilus TaxID=522488 RepID=A0ABQ2GKH9_9DEIO|nr:hypothetical protein [Deinococcus aerophilus]GGL99986.1 hypothetical protein GCM10010841_05700 [Deinococcus aerophilus]
MPSPLLAAVSRLLPSEDRVLTWLRDPRPRERQEVTEQFSVVLREFDVVIGLPDAQPVAHALSRLRGTPMVVAAHNTRTGHWTLPPLQGELRSAVIVTHQLRSGLPELEVALLAAAHGCAVHSVAATLERTNDQGRSRLELQDIVVYAAVQLADTPEGLALERRFPQPDTTH